MVGRNKIGLLICLAIAWVLLSACEHKELCYDHPHFTTVRVDFDWSQIDKEEMPEGMRVVFYPTDGGDSWIFDFPEGKGQTIELPQKEYQTVCYNYDTRGIDWTGQDSYRELTAETRKVASPDSIAMRAVSGFLCSSALDSVVLKEQPNGSETVVLFQPRRNVCRYTYEIRGLKELSRVAALRAGLSDMGGSLNLAADSIPEDLSETVLFGGEVKDSLIVGKFYTFGWSQKGETDHNQFRLYVKSTAGKMYKLDADVTEQIRKVPLKGHIGDVHLIIYLDFSIPNDPNGDTQSGFEVNVDEWEDIYIDIIV